MSFASVQTIKQTRAWVWARNSSIGELLKGCKRCAREIRAWTRPGRVTAPHVHEVVAALASLHMGPADSGQEQQDEGAPIFLLSNGMRTGSTLLQRVLVTDPRVLLWGEPLGDMALICRITEMISQSICPWNLEQWKNHDPKSSSIATSWISDLYPPGEDFRLALRGLIDRWLHLPARNLGFSRWGFKEVRLGGAEAVLLHWLYPNAKFLILSRNPFDAYRSLADSKWLVYHRYPDICLDSAASFARVWNELALSWSELPPGFPSYTVKYEDLVSGKIDFRKLEAWLDIKIKENVALSATVGGTAKRTRLSWYERLIIKKETAPGRKALGYSD